MSYLKIGAIINILHTKLIPRNTRYLGRWNLKNNTQSEYYAHQIHADPGYPNKYYKIKKKSDKFNK